MKKSKQKLIIEQMDKKLGFFDAVKSIEPPVTGWIRAIRTALKMPLLQFAGRMKIAPPSAKELEQREAFGTITLKSLKEAAKAMDMKFVYGFVPLKGSLQATVEQRAYEVARNIVMRTSQSMKLEDQEVAKARLEKSIRELAEEIKQEMPRYLWDLK